MLLAVVLLEVCESLLILAELKGADAGLHEYCGACLGTVLLHDVGQAEHVAVSAEGEFPLTVGEALLCRISLLFSLDALGLID